MENQPPNNGLIIQNQTENTLQRLSYAMELTKKVLAEGNECPLTMEWWNGLLKYGNLEKKGLENYTWQDIFRVNLAFWEKGIALNEGLIFEIYEQEFKIPFAPQLSKITQQELNKIYQINTFWLSYCDIDTLEPLRELKNLQILNCNYNEINNLEPLRELKKLQKLDCHWNNISSL